MRASTTAGRADGPSPLRPAEAGHPATPGEAPSGKAPRAPAEGVKVDGGARDRSAREVDGSAVTTGDRGWGGAGGQDLGAGGAGGAGGLGEPPEDGAIPLTASGGMGPSADQACSDSANARCKRLSDCSNGAIITQRYGDLATCALRGKLGCMESLAAPGTGATPASVAGCAASLPSEPCGPLLDGSVGPACKPQSGARPPGAGCAFSAQCMTAFCLVPRGQACGTCVLEPAPGAPCASTNDCGRAQTCTKVNGCTAWVRDDGACDKNTPCGSGLACVGATATSAGTCLPQQDIPGAACDPTRRSAVDCDRNHGLYCDAASRTCLAVAYEGPGQACGLVGGSLRACVNGAQCVVSVAQQPGTCVPTAPDGAGCDVVKGPQCLSPARCSNGVCTLPDGASCQ